MQVPLFHPPRTAVTQFAASSSFDASYAEILDPMFVVQTNVDIPNFDKALAPGDLTPEQEQVVREFTNNITDSLPEYMVLFEWISPRAIIVSVIDKDTEKVPDKKKWPDIIDAMQGPMVSRAKKLASDEYYSLKYEGKAIEELFPSTFLVGRGPGGVPVWLYIAAGVGLVAVGLVVSSKQSPKKKRR